MTDFEKELKELLETDPLGLLDTKPKASNVITADKRLADSFMEINSFVAEKGREPQVSTDIGERRLFSRLKGIRENPEKAAALLELDKFGLLADVKIPDPSSIQTIDDVLDGDTLGLLDDISPEESDPDDIFVLKNIPKASAPPDFVAKRKPCKEFDQFDPLFKENHAALSIRTKVTRPFNSERQIKPGEFFIVDGVMVYVANQGHWEKKNFGNVNARLYCVFENGTESNMLLRSLAAALWKDKNSRQIIDADQLNLFEKDDSIQKDDQSTGFIYILKSLSENPEILNTKDLYKVGYSTQTVRERVADAKNDPTYLMADVKVVAEFETYNLVPQKFELLLHKFFAASCLNIDVFDNKKVRHTPREWFVAPSHVIQQAIGYIIDEEITQFRYDPKRQEIIRKDKK